VPAATPAAIEVRGLSVRYPGAGRPALDGLTLDVAPGEWLGIVGLTGAGKSTLMRCLNGIVPELVPARVEGTVSVGGIDVRATPVRELARRVGVVLDDPDTQLSRATVAEEVALGLEATAIPWDEIVARVAGTLEAVGLAGLEGRSPLTLSGGEQQRLVIACALAMRTQILLMDEPTASLDAAGTAAVLDIVRWLNREQGMTVVLAAHDVELLAEHVDRIMVLDRGRLLMEGTPATVFSRCAELADLGLGVPQVTQVAATVAGVHDGADVAARPGGSTLLPVTIEGAVAWLAGRS
jgi:energy-coupling factor transporter ATP-binding protein EcfA2